MQSPKNTLSKEDIKSWLMNLLVFSSPALIAFLTALQNGVDYKIAWGMLCQAFMASGIDLLIKLKAGS